MYKSLKYGVYTVIVQHLIVHALVHDPGSNDETGRRTRYGQTFLLDTRVVTLIGFELCISEY